MIEDFYDFSGEVIMLCFFAVLVPSFLIVGEVSFKSMFYFFS
jgi:hypothetical protein